MQRLRMLWAGMMGWTVVIAVASFVLPHQDAPVPAMLIGFIAIAVGEAVASFIVPALILRRVFADLEVETLDEPAPADDALMSGSAPRMWKVLTHPDQALRAALPRYQQPFIFGLAFSEAVVLNGVALNLMGFPAAAFLPFLVGGLVLLAIHYPTEDRLLAAIEAGTGARAPARR